MGISLALMGDAVAARHAMRTVVKATRAKRVRGARRHWRA